MSSGLCRSTGGVLWGLASELLVLSCAHLSLMQPSFAHFLAVVEWMANWAWVTVVAIIPVTVGEPHTAGGPWATAPQIGTSCTSPFPPPSCTLGRLGPGSCDSSEVPGVGLGETSQTFHDKPQRP